MLRAAFRNDAVKLVKVRVKVVNCGRVSLHFRNEESE